VRTPSQTDDALNPPPTQPPHHPYHHGDLRNALVQAAAELASEGGPSAIVLREAARRVGVSPTAAYRYFDALPELVGAVAQVAMTSMGHAMEAQIALCSPTGDPREDARNYMLAVGRGYVQFALAEPGLFSTAFSCPEGSENIDDGGLPQTDCSPAGLLRQALAGLLAAGLLNPADHEAAGTTAWATVHGLSMLLLGPMADLPPNDRQLVTDACLKLVVRGMITQV
jgi:AcrR family transcriptional regulator